MPSLMARDRGDIVTSGKKEAVLQEAHVAESLRDGLQNLAIGCEAVTTRLISRDGHNIAEAGDTRSIDAVSLAALVAGMFSATREVARLVGEEQFSIMLQQGERRHIHISLVNDSVMLVIIFEDYQKIGLVRHEARKAGRLFAELLDDGARGIQPAEMGEQSIAAFREYALNIIDRIFAGK